MSFTLLEWKSVTLCDCSVVTSKDTTRINDNIYLHASFVRFSACTSSFPSNSLYISHSLEIRRWEMMPNDRHRRISAK